MLRLPAALLSIPLMFVLLIALACDGGSDADPTPTTTGPAATATVEPTATLGPSSSALIVYVLGDDLWLAPLDGSAAPRAITSGAIAAHFAGATGDAIYYTERLSEGTEGTGLEHPRADAALYRVSLTGGEPEELLRFDGRRLSSFSASPAALSPDGASVLVGDADGVMLLDLASLDTRRLLTNSPPCQGPQDCFGYFVRSWSPDGSLALIGKGFWEGGADILIDPFAETIEETRTSGGAAIDARWSADGASICMSEFTYANAGAVLVYDVATGEFADATTQLDLPTPALPDALVIDTRGCAWAPDRVLAIAYHAPDDFRTTTIAIVDPETFAVAAESEPIRDLSNLAGWLPDGSSVVFNRWQAQEGVPRPPGIFDPARGVVDLPFEADEIVAVIS